MKKILRVNLNLLGLLLLTSNMSFGQLTPEKANKKMDMMGYLVLNHDYQTNELLSQLKSISLIDGEIVANEGFIILHGEDEDIIVNDTRAVTIRIPGGGSITRTCASQTETCNVKSTSAGKYSCDGEDCAGLVTIRVSATGEVTVER